MDFSKELIDQTKAYFKKKHGRKLSDSQANQYLEKLGTVGLIAYDLLTSSASAPVPSVAEKDHGGAVVKSETVGRVRGGTELVSQYPQTPVGDD